MAKVFQKSLRNPVSGSSDNFVMERSRCCIVPDFPLGVVKSISQSLRHYHVHENFSELVLVTAGSGIHEVNGRSYPISAGDIFLVQGDLCHCYSDGYGLSIWNVLFCWEELQLPKLDVGQIAAFHNLFVIDPVNGDPDRFDRRFRMNQDDFNQIMRKVQDLGTLLTEKPDGVKFLALSKFMEIIAFLLSAYEHTVDAAVTGTIPHRMATLVAELERRYSEPINIEQMCRIAGMSYASLFRHFRKYYDDTPLNYLLRQRLQRACELFEQQPGIAVSEVAFRCGFTDSAYFSRKFHEYYHMPPSAWRTLNAGK